MRKWAGPANQQRPKGRGPALLTNERARRLLVYRDAKKVEEMTTRAGNIPAERERNIVKRDGFSYEV